MLLSGVFIVAKFGQKNGAIKMLHPVSFIYNSLNAAGVWSAGGECWEAVNPSIFHE